MGEMDCCSKPEFSRKRRREPKSELERFPKYREQTDNIKKELMDELEVSKKKYHEATKEYLTVLTAVTEQLYQESVEKLERISKKYAEMSATGCPRCSSSCSAETEEPGDKAPSLRNLDNTK